MTTTRRRSFVSKPTFQLKLTIIFMLMVTIVANLVGGLCFFFISDRTSDLLDQLSSRTGLLEGVPMSEVAQLLIPRILVAEGISLLIVFFLCIWVTHTVAGPLYRMERVAKQIGEGDLSMVTRLRPKDELQELADAFNVMTRGLAARVYALRDAVDRMAAGADPTKSVAALQQALARFTLPARAELEGPGPDVEEDTYAAPFEDEDEPHAAADGPGEPEHAGAAPRTRSRKARPKAGHEEGA